ncbi:hypothetical protein [Janibacter melonis]|uniref:hypothetical protein n=1 Tax=Janibacter melonis TaxID=262209 RepID=UPI0020956FC0|nr:hypothetical protein [Janibacter melonis]
MPEVRRADVLACSAHHGSDLAGDPQVRPRHPDDDVAEPAQRVRALLLPPQHRGVAVGVLDAAVELDDHPVVDEQVDPGDELAVLVADLDLRHRHDPGDAQLAAGLALPTDSGPSVDERQHRADPAGAGPPADVVQRSRQLLESDRPGVQGVVRADDPGDRSGVHRHLDERLGSAVVGPSDVSATGPVERRKTAPSPRCRDPGPPQDRSAEIRTRHGRAVREDRADAGERALG